MKKKLCLLLAGVSLLTSALPAIPNCNPFGCGGLEVIALRFDQFGKGSFRVTNDLTPLNCTPSNPGNWIIMSGQDGTDFHYSMVMTALANGLALTYVEMDSNNPTCTVEFITLNKNEFGY